ncbi:Kv channel-interacting protein 2 [Trachymyrmex cornetzi]|uniref:Kv channel-interacting protein 2 n=1 Tax=Trachymyrmex cornetzi TaxID=471704 RepID=A0A195E5A0_9HYME|nr:Kv channel-interacting protein 2 [Trachymyrmex cornetzi]
MLIKDELLGETHPKLSAVRTSFLVGIYRHAIVNRLNILATAGFIKTALCSRLRQFRSAQHSSKIVDHCQTHLISQNIQEDDKHSLYVFPEQLSTLTWRTGFSKDEIRKLYRAFKQLCPRGCATSSDLKPAYAKLFPLGDSARYAQIVFHNIDRNGDGIVNFNDFLRAMTSIINGNVDQKLSWIFEDLIIISKAIQWGLKDVIFIRIRRIKLILSSDLLLFRFYDLNGDGCITRQEMLTIISAIYEMVQNAQTIQSMVNQQVDKFFEKMDANRDGIVSREEFMNGCKNVWNPLLRDAIIYNQLFLFNKIW